jgi:hypothetical protein
MNFIMKKKRRQTVVSLVFILFLICCDVFLFPISSDVRIFGILAIFLYFMKRFAYNSSTTFLFSLVLFALTYIQYILTDPALYHVPIVPTAERTAVWLYLFLVIGVVQKWRE